MGIFMWRQEYAIDHSLIDAQHRGLFHLGDELHAAMMRGAGDVVISNTLCQLAEYARRHFHDEEAVMQEYGYPLYEEHKAEHEALTKQVSDLIRGLKSGHITVTMDTMHFLRDWLDQSRDAIGPADRPVHRCPGRTVRSGGSGRKAVIQ